MGDVWSARDRDLLEALQEMWSHRDPPPAGLADDLIAVLAGAGLEEDWELLRLVGGDLTGIRSSSEVSTFEFDLGSVSVVVRLAPESPSSRRLDGWLTRAGDPGDAEYPPGRVVLVIDDAERVGVIDAEGRFEFSGIRGDHWRLRFLAPDGARRFQTPDMPL